MDRDINENVIDPEERKTPSTGQSDYGSSGYQRRREAEERGDDVDRSPRKCRSTRTDARRYPIQARRSSAWRSTS